MTSWPGRGLYAVTDSSLLTDRDLAGAVANAIDGGARAVQYRDKSTDHRKRRQEVSALLALCREAGVPLIINDDVDLAKAIGADGVHVGLQDTGVAAAREALGAGAIIGASCNDSLERAQAAADAGASYVAFGRFFPSKTKPKATSAPLGLLHRARTRLRLPIVAIGGITPENGALLLNAGADLLAVVQGVFAAHDVARAARRFHDLFDPQQS
ncbi:MAG: thiamine phosphate synthase [Gammaproteobacteria bacterium]|nr:MAG: thiamine phosphate synthase [Gammaproteobacteria bacterium]